jgi:hypothetical protein
MQSSQPTGPTTAPATGSGSETRPPESLPAVQILFDRFLDLVNLILNYQSADPEQKNPGAGSSENHSSGQFQAVLSQGPRLAPDQIQKWFLNAEYGLLHGLLVAFWAIMYKRRNDLSYHPEDEALIASCLVHEFLRCQGLHDQYDEKLVDFFPALIPMSYRHAKSPEHSHPLVVGNQINLLRHQDSNEGGDPKILTSYVQGEKSQSLVTAFFRFVVPALERVSEQRDEIWIRHSPEGKFVIDLGNKEPDGLTGTVGEEDRKFFPWRYWAPYPEHWCIEIGTAPFGPIITRDVGYYRVLPVISSSTLRRYTSEPILPFRDHQCVRGKIPVSEWITLYLAEDFDRIADYPLFARGCGMVELAIANKLLVTTQTIRNLVTGLRAVRRSGRPQ